MVIGTPEPYYYKLEIISQHSKSPTEIGSFTESIIEVYCWAIDARAAIAVAEEAAKAQHVTVDRIKNVVCTEIPLSAHIEPPPAILGRDN